jgi:UDP-glucose 4-epimerase
MAGVEGIFHAAAMSRAGPSLDNIDECTQTNIVGTQNLLVAARGSRVRKVVYSGSSTYYGNQPPPHHEFETPAQFLNFYSLSKQVGEQYILMFDRIFDVPGVVLRYFNVYGPRQPQVGAYALVLGIFLRRWVNGEPLVIHGDGRQRRDFIHVRDVVDANIAAFESNCRHDIFNVGSGTNVSIKELADLISPNQVHEDRRKGDAEVTLADTARIQAALGFIPKVPFKSGVEELMVRVKAGLE